MQTILKHMTWVLSLVSIETVKVFAGFGLCDGLVSSGEVMGTGIHNHLLCSLSLLQEIHAVEKLLSECSEGTLTML